MQFRLVLRLISLLNLELKMRNILGFLMDSYGMVVFILK